MAFFIAIETSTKACSVALFHDQKLIAFKEINIDYSHAENLAVFVKSLINNEGLSYSQISAIAVSKGPGSYTGLRIGVSFAKGLSYALQVPLISVNTLKAMAIGARTLIEDSDFFLCPMIDARRMEVYTAVFDVCLNFVKPITAEVIDESSFQEFINQKKTFFFGDGSEKCKKTLKHANSCFINEPIVSARNMGEIVNEKFIKEQFEDVAYFEPYYLKEFIPLKGKKLV